MNIWSMDEIAKRLDLHGHKAYVSSPVGIASAGGNEIQNVTINGDFWCYSVSVFAYDTAGNILTAETPRDIFTLVWGDQLRQFVNAAIEPFDLNTDATVQIFKGRVMNDRDIITFTTTSLGLPGTPVNTYPVFFRYQMNGYILTNSPGQPNIG